MTPIQSIGLLICIWLLGAWNSSYGQQHRKYLIATSQVDSLVLVKHKLGKTTRARIPSFSLKEGGYILPLPDTVGIAIQAKCRCCKDPVTFRILDVETGRSSFYISLVDGEEIRLSQCHTVSPGGGAGCDHSCQIRNFWKEFNRQGNGSSHFCSTMGSNDPEQLQLIFCQTNNGTFLDLDNFSVTWISSLPVREIYFFGAQEGMILYSSDSLQANRWCKTRPIDKADIPRWFPGTFETSPEDRPFSHFTLDLKKLMAQVPGTFGLERGQAYQLGVDLSGDSSGFSPYLFTFSFFTEREIQQMGAGLGENLSLEKLLK